jgi:uncharacterized membrane protein
MNKVVVVVFNDERQAYEGSRALHELHKEGGVTLYADAVIVKERSGRVSVKHATAEGPTGTLFGLLSGALVGLLGGPVGPAIGAGAGTLVGAAFDLARAGINGDFLEDVSEHLLPGTAAVITEVDEEWQAPIDGRMEALHGHVFRRNRIDIDDSCFEKEIAACRSELAALVAEHARASKNLKVRIEGKIEDVRRRLENKEDEVEARIEAIKREGDAKMTCLQQQLKDAAVDARGRLEERMSEVRSEYRVRANKLQQAWQLAKSALTR